jgi:hypothetical protein
MTITHTKGGDEKIPPEKFQKVFVATVSSIENQTKLRRK